MKNRRSTIRIACLAALLAAAPLLWGTAISINDLTPSAGDPVSLTVGGAGGAPVLIWMSIGSTPMMTDFGTVHAYPFVTQLLTTSGAVLSTTWPPGIPLGTEFYFQGIVISSAMPYYVVGLTNHVKVTSM